MQAAPECTMRPARIDGDDVPMTDSSPRPPARVLLVDDDIAVLRNFRLCLEEAGYQTNTAQNSAQALAALARGVFDVCLLDFRLGEESGIDLLPALRQAAPWLRIVMATAEGDA